MSTEDRQWPGPWAESGLTWPALGDADPGAVSQSALAVAAHYLWQDPDLLWAGARARRFTDREPVRWSSSRWDAEDVWLVEHLDFTEPWFGPAYPGWRTQRNRLLAAEVFGVTHALRCLPELLSRELTRRGVKSLDARLSGVRMVARELGWRAVSVRRFVSRQAPFHPLTAWAVCECLALSTDVAGAPVDSHPQPDTSDGLIAPEPDTSDGLSPTPVTGLGTTTGTTTQD